MSVIVVQYGVAEHQGSTHTTYKSMKVVALRLHFQDLMLLDTHKMQSLL